VGAIVFLILIN